MSYASAPQSPAFRFVAPGTGCKSQPWRIALYSHDTVGLGHTRRNLAVAQVLSERFPNASILLLTGNALAGQFIAPPRVDFLTLPALAKNKVGHYEARTLDVALDDLLELRSRAIKSALKAFKPDVFIVDNVPTGAGGELTRSLKLLRKRGRTHCVLGLRDVLDAPEAVKNQWSRGGYERAIRRFFDDVWVYGDPQVCRQEEVYGYSPETRRKVRYLGYFDGRARLAAAPPVPNILRPELGKLVLAQVGGGEDGMKLARAFAETELPEGYYGVLLSGPHMPSEVKRALQRRAEENPRLQVLEFVKEPTWLLQHAERVIAMGGYNTTFETLAFDKPLLTVPRVRPRLEQYVRAEALSRLGLLDYLHPDALTPAALRAWLEVEKLAPAAREQLQFNAADTLTDALCSALLAAPTPLLQEVHHVAA